MEKIEKVSTSYWKKQDTQHQTYLEESMLLRMLNWDLARKNYIDKIEIIQGHWANWAACYEWLASIQAQDPVKALQIEKNLVEVFEKKEKRIFNLKRRKAHEAKWLERYRNLKHIPQTTGTDEGQELLRQLWGNNKGHNNKDM